MCSCSVTHSLNVIMTLRTILSSILTMHGEISPLDWTGRAADIGYYRFELQSLTPSQRSVSLSRNSGHKSCPLSYLCLTCLSLPVSLHPLSYSVTTYVITYSLLSSLLSSYLFSLPNIFSQWCLHFTILVLSFNIRTVLTISVSTLRTGTQSIRTVYPFGVYCAG